MTPPPFQAILCDIDGVLRHWPPVTDIEHEHSLAEGVLLATAFAHERLIPAITGLITDEQWRQSVAAALLDACSGSAARAQAAVDAWSVVMPAVDADVVALLADFRDVAKVALVSNGTTRLESDLEQQGLSGLAHVVVNTSRIGFAKPNPRVYTIAAELVDVAPEGCLFVDDTEANVVAARGAGMTAVHYRQLSDLRDALSV